MSSLLKPRTKKVFILFRYLKFVIFITDGISLHLKELRIPTYVVRNQGARLECLFDLDGEILYSVKWFKDGKEFYRYVPRDQPPDKVFPLPGVTVDVSTLTFNT